VTFVVVAAHLSMFDVNHNRQVYLVVVESMQELEPLVMLTERKKIPKARYFGAAGRGFEAEWKPPRIGAVSTEGQVVSQVEIAEIVAVGAEGSEKVGNGSRKLGYLVDIGWSIAAGYGQM
jgi:hypothetical protein